MNYIENNLQAGEEIKYVAKLHFFLFVQPLVLLLLGWWLYGSETAVKMITDLMRVVGVDSYNKDLPLSRYLMDALALPLFDGGNMGVRRNQYHQILMSDSYNSLDTLLE